jgi:hypothetical protein
MIVQDGKIVSAIKPQTGGNAISSAWINMANYSKATVVIEIAQGNAATTAITLDKAKTSAGGSNTDGITIQNWWSMVDVAGTTQAAASDTFTKGTAHTSITSSATGTGCSLYVIEISAEELGQGYNFFQVELGASNAANIASCLVILTGAAYGGPSTPTALA